MLFFTRKEFACKCGCGFAAMDFELLDILLDIREAFQRPVIINSACRCEAHNKTINGSKNSMHVKGMAADIVVKGIPAHMVYEYLDGRYPNKYGIGKYNSWTHIDVREDKARWDNTKQ